MVIKKEDKKEEVSEVIEQPQQINIVTQIVTALQSLVTRVSSLELDAKKTTANEQLMDKQIAFLGERIDFLKEKHKL